MSLQSAFPFVFSFLPQKPLVVEVSNEALSIDGGLIPIRQFDERIGFTRQIAEALDDRRDSALTPHSLVSMIRQRIYGILADYEVQNDHESLRLDPVFSIWTSPWKRTTLSVRLRPGETWELRLILSKVSGRFCIRIAKT